MQVQFGSENRVVAESNAQDRSFSSNNEQELSSKNLDKNILDLVKNVDPKSEDDINAVTQGLEKILQSKESLFYLQNRELNFSFRDDIGRTVVEVTDKETDEVIRQIPSEEFIRLAEKIASLTEELSTVQGVLFDSKV
ncbi:hypothetical protein GBO14_05580 [Pseudoalteromonas shioyasakiensis]|uniref:flagellar protein FlaG n=1 Tax=Pseudoalteromonas shioyasakiensis TaxID=1190813 RepID=UPI0020953D6F|nr:flagellar protein FlaG [Pseudoalteromonas shioyasakiensis]MCO6354220.1 hypothetical protein [Pseudoalteromonas shioyasakiensis]